jgi:outer membrane receptor protein involved in Fe transport
LTGGVENLTDNQYREHFDSRQQDVFVGGGTVNIGGTGNVFQPGISFYFGSELRY